MCHVTIIQQLQKETLVHFDCTQLTIKHCVLLFLGILQFNEHVYLQHSE